MIDPASLEKSSGILGHYARYVYINDTISEWKRQSAAAELPSAIQNIVLADIIEVFMSR